MRNEKPTAVARASRSTHAILLILLAATLAGKAHAAVPSLSVTPHQTRTRAAVSLMPLWDTSWWVTLQAARGAAPLARVEYGARFVDGEPRAVAGSIEVGAADRDGLSGRIVVTCPTRPDYEKKLRVKLRVSDTTGAVSEWVEAEFPVRGETAAETTQTSPSVTVAGAERRYENLGPVEVDATADMTIEAVKAALLRKAREQGADAAIGLRLIKSDDRHTTFAADAIRYVAAESLPTPAAMPVVSDRVLGEFVMPAARR